MPIHIEIDLPDGAPDLGHAVGGIVKSALYARAATISITHRRQEPPASPTTDQESTP